MTGPTNGRRPVHRVLVGFDGSAASDVALDWAVEIARRSDATVEIVSASDWPAVLGEPVSLTQWDPRHKAREVITRALKDRNLDPSEIVITIENGSPGHVLVAASAHGDLLVVGRGGSRLDHLLGSVSDHCVRRSACPVCVVPTHADQLTATHS